MDTVEAGVLIFFVLALSAVLKLRSQIRSYSPESYNAIAGGLSLLALSAMARTYYGLGLIEGIPFLSEPLFYELLLWILAITGGALTVSGVSSWLPLARKHYRYSESRLRRLELLKHVEQLVGVESRLDVVLERSLQHIVDHFDMTGGMVFKYSGRRDKLVLVSRTGDPMVDSDDLGGMTVDHLRLRAFLNGESHDNGRLFRNRPSDMPRPRRVMPLQAGGRIVGFYAFWAKKGRLLASEDDMMLRLVIDTVVRKIEQERFALQTKASTVTVNLESAFCRAIHEASDVKDAFLRVVSAIRQVAPADYAAFSILDGGRSIKRRYSCGKDSGILVESALPGPSLRALSTPTFAHGQVVAVADSSRRGGLETAELVAGPTARSFAAVPIISGGSTVAVLLVGSDTPSVYTGTTMTIIRRASVALTSLVDRDTQTANSELARRRLANAAALFDDVAGASQESLWQKAAQLLVDETGAQAVRISTIEDRGAFLKSRAFVSGGEVSGAAPEDGSLITSLLPWHQRVLESRQARTEAAIQSEQGGERLEARQVFGMQPSATMLVPIVVRASSVGVIALARESASGGAFKDDTVDFVRLVAQALAAAIRASGSAPVAKDRSVARRDHEDLGRLRSWLTGILGSVELMNSRHDQIADDNFRRYMDTLNKSARRISDYLKEERRDESTIGV